MRCSCRPQSGPTCWPMLAGCGRSRHVRSLIRMPSRTSRRRQCRRGVCCPSGRCCGVPEYNGQDYTENHTERDEHRYVVGSSGMASHCASKMVGSAFGVDSANTLMVPQMCMPIRPEPPTGSDRIEATAPTGVSRYSPATAPRAPASPAGRPKLRRAEPQPQ